MDSINNFFSKGYGKLSNPTDAFPPPQPSRNRRPLLVSAAIFLLTLFLLFLLAALIHESATEPPESSLLRSNLTSSILFVCRSTQHPESCFDSITSSVNGSAHPGDDPVSILRLSLAVCSHELDIVSGNFAELAGRDGTSDAGLRAAAVEDCRGQIEDASSKVEDSAKRIGVDAGIPSEDAMADVTTWMSAAMTDGETCVDGMEEAGGSTAGADDRVKEGMRKAREYMSNSLAIAVNLKKIVREFDVELH